MTTLAHATIAAPLNAEGIQDLEPTTCYLCGSDSARPFMTAEDDLTGKPGRFSFVTCDECSLVYQQPRVTLSGIKAYYDDDYIAHRRRSDWGIMRRFFERSMDRLDARKEDMVAQYTLLDHSRRLLDVGCGAGTFAARLHRRRGVHAVGLDFKELSDLPSFADVEFRCGLLYDHDFADERFDLITMWHFLEHDYDPARSLRTSRELLTQEGRLVIEVPRLDSVTFKMYGDRWPGLQAPQHTALYSRQTLIGMVERAGLEVVDYLPYGAFPAYFYLFTGAAFRLLKGRGLNLKRALVPYAIGQAVLSPLLVFERRLNLAMQTVVCRRPT